MGDPHKWGLMSVIQKSYTEKKTLGQPSYVLHDVMVATDAILKFLNTLYKYSQNPASISSHHLIDD